VRASLVQLTALCSFALAQPLFDLLGRFPEFFPANGVGAGAAVIVALVAVSIPPLLLWGGLEWPARLIGESLLRVVHCLLMALLFALIVLTPLVRALPASSWPLALGVALLAGGAFAVLLERFEPLRRVVGLLSGAALVFPLLFLTQPGIRALFESAEGFVPASSEAGRSVPIVLVVFDELPLSALLTETGDVDRVRFPHFAELAAGAHFFRNATSVADGTVHAVPAILAGERVEDSNRSPTDAGYPANLFTWLAPSYDMVVHESASRLCPPGSCRALPEQGNSAARLAYDLFVVSLHAVLPQPLTQGLPDISQGWGAFGAQEAPEPSVAEQEPFGGDWLKFVGRSLQLDRVDLFRRFVGEIRPSARPGLWVLHILLPHPPLEFLPSGATYPRGPTPGLAREHWSSDPWAALQGWQRFLLQLQFVDGLVGELLEHLRDTGLYDASLLIVTGDHGSSYRADDSRRAWSDSNAIDVLTVPIFLKEPGQTQPAVSDAPSETIDILPTIAEVLGLEPPPGVDGRSLLAPPLVERERRALSYADRKLHPIGETRAGVDERVAQKHDSFGPPNENASFFAVGPHRGLVGRWVEDIEREGGIELAPAPATLKASAHWVRGELERDGEQETPTDLALVVYGQVRAVTRTYLDTRPAQFSALFERAVAPSEIEVFEIEASPR
jgi:hypothetical protein